MRRANAESENAFCSPLRQLSTRQINGVNVLVSIDGHVALSKVGTSMGWVDIRWVLYSVTARGCLLLVAPLCTAAVYRAKIEREHVREPAPPLTLVSIHQCSAAKPEQKLGSRRKHVQYSVRAHVVALGLRRQLVWLRGHAQRRLLSSRNGSSCRGRRNANECLCPGTQRQERRSDHSQGGGRHGCAGAKAKNLAS